MKALGACLADERPRHRRPRPVHRRFEWCPGARIQSIYHFFFLSRFVPNVSPTPQTMRPHVARSTALGIAAPSLTRRTPTSHTRRRAHDTPHHAPREPRSAPLTASSSLSARHHDRAVEVVDHAAQPSGSNRARASRTTAPERPPQGSTRGRRSSPVNSLDAATNPAHLCTRARAHAHGHCWVR